jgi:Flp pilus assembly pilin Flp
MVCLHRDETGQGLIEYVLIMGLITFAATAAIQALASGINSAFSLIGSTLAQAIS